MSAEEQNIIRVPEKTSEKSRIEYEAFDGDRIPLVQAANDFVKVMVDRESFALLSFATYDQSETEQETYESALAFLRQEFNAGAQLKPRTYKKAVETEKSVDVILIDPKVPRTSMGEGGEEG